MKRLYLILIPLILPFCLLAQEKLENPNDSLHGLSVEALKQSVNSYKYKDAAKAQLYASELFKRAQLNRNILYDAAYLRAEIYNVLEDKDSAFYYVDIAIKEAQQNKEEENYINSLLLKGNICYDADLYEKAIDVFIKAFTLAEKQNDVEKLAGIRHSISLVRKQIGQYKQAIELAKENFVLFDEGTLDKQKLPIKYINTLMSLSNIYIHLADNFSEEKQQYLDSAEVFNTRGLKKSFALNDLEGHSVFLTMKGIINQKNGQLDSALIYLKAAEKQIKKLGFNNQLSVLYQFEGKNYFLQEEYDDAITYLLKVDSIIGNKNSNAPTLKETYILLAESYEKKNNAALTIKYFKIFDEIDKQNDIYKDKVSERLYKEYDVPSLKKRIKILQSNSQKAEQESKLLLTICVLLVVISGLVFLYYKKREQIQKKRFQNLLKELKEKEEKQNTTVHEKKSQPYVITDENVRKIIEGLEKFEAKKLYLQKNCTLNYVAKKINTNSTYLSKTLQSHKQKKFVQYITDLRLDYALTQLKNDKKFRTYDIKSIAFELGFNTSESFSKAFKKRTGIYPSFYIKNLNKLKEEEVNI